MIVLCPKAFAGKSLMLERRFLLYYLSKVDEKAIVASEVWDSFRFRITKKKDPEIANKIITNMRGSFRPELIKLNKEFEEEAPKDYKDNELKEKTKDLVERKWADIDFFIVEDPEEYGTTKVKPITLAEFYVKCMRHTGKRSLMEDFMHKEIFEKYQ